MPSVKFEKKPILLSLKALIDTSVILNCCLEEQISPPKIASVRFPSEII